MYKKKVNKKGQTVLVNEVGEQIRETWPIALYYNSEGRLVYFTCPHGVKPQDTILGKAADIYSDLTFTVPAARASRNILRKSPRATIVYLDCGRWGGGGKSRYSKQRNFGLVWGRWVVLCNFVRAKNVSGEPVASVDRGGLIDKFIGGLRTTSTTVNIEKMIYCREAVKPKWDHLYVLLPDLHLPAVTKKPNTSTVWLPDGKPMEVIDSEKPMWRILGRNDKPYTPSSAAEWFDSYARGDIFDGAADDLVCFLDLIHFSPVKHKIHFVQMGDMYDLWIGFIRSYKEQTEHRVKLQTGANSFIKHWIARTSRENKRVIQAFDRLVHQDKLPCTFLYGNHDNYLAPSVCPHISNLPARTKEIVEPEHLFIDHGHRMDSSNRDGATNGHWLTNKVFVDPSLRDADPNRRQEWTVKTAVHWMSLSNANRFYIYVQAHTHSPYLTKIKLSVALAKKSSDRNAPSAGVGTGTSDDAK